MFELVRCEVVEARMRPDFIVMAAPGFDDHLRLASAAEPLEAQALVTEAAVEALVHAVLPRLTRIDQRRFDTRLLQPFEDRFAHEFGAIVHAECQPSRVRASFGLSVDRRRNPRWLTFRMVIESSIWSRSTSVDMRMRCWSRLKRASGTGSRWPTRPPISSGCSPSYVACRATA